MNYVDKVNVERIPISAKNVGHLFHMNSEIIKSDKLHLFLLFDGTRIDNNEYLKSIESAIELIVCTH